MWPRTDPAASSDLTKHRHLALLAADEVVREVLPHLVDERVKERTSDTLTVKDLKAKYRVCGQTVRNWMKWGWLPAPLYNPGRKFVWDRRTVEEHFARLKASQTAQDTSDGPTGTSTLPNAS